MNNDDPLLITGAGGGLGTRLIEYLLQSGRRNLVCHCRQRSEEIQHLFKRYDLNPEQRLFRGDLCDETHVAAVRQEVETRVGPLYGLINLAGGSTNKMSWKLGTDEFRQVLDQNLLTTFLVCREFVPAMRQQGRGRIVNISSVVAFTGAVGASHYCAAKAAIVGFSRSLALELAPKKISVSTVALGYFQYGLIETLNDEFKDHIRSKIPLQTFGDLESLGGLMTFLLGSGGEYATGQVYHLNGGLYS